MTRLDDTLKVALEGGDPRPFFSELERVSGMPGPRPNLVLLKSIGATIARGGTDGRELIDVMIAEKRQALFQTGVYAVAHLAAQKGLKGNAFDALHDLADDSVKERRDAVADALADAVAAVGDDAARLLVRFTDGFLHAHVALEALTQERSLARLSSADEIVARFSEAFDLADTATRSADRSQGLRILREGMPAQIARAVPRFGELVSFVEERTTRERPETREVVAKTISALRRVIGESRADRLRAQLAASDKPLRDAARVVHGTRKRSRGRI
ncbi:MAG: hypothetical protein JNL21_21900 [Myxococcales bacterium]|nr:hypothetical protein [Myxococcales bacterium]